MAAAPRKRRRPRVRTMRRLLETALIATPEEIELFCFDNIDIDTAEVIVRGTTSRAEMADELGISEQALLYRLRNPARCAWIAQQICKIIPQRVGMVYAAMYTAACRGSVQAANLVLERFDPLFRPAHASINSLTQIKVDQIDITRLSDEELGARIQEKLAALGAGKTAEIARRAEGEAGAQPPAIPEAARQATPSPGQ